MPGYWISIDFDTDRPLSDVTRLAADLVQLAALEDDVAVDGVSVSTYREEDDGTVTTELVASSHTIDPET